MGGEVVQVFLSVGGERRQDDQLDLFPVLIEAVPLLTQFFEMMAESVQPEASWIRFHST